MFAENINRKILKSVIQGREEKNEMNKKKKYGYFTNECGNVCR